MELKGQIHQMECDIAILNAAAMDMRKNADQMWEAINNNIGESPEYRPQMDLLMGWTLVKYLPALELEEHYKKLQNDIIISNEYLCRYRKQMNEENEDFMRILGLVNN